MKPVSRAGTARLVRAATQYALHNKRKSVTLVHKGHIMQFTEGAFRDWGYDTAETEFLALSLYRVPWHDITAPSCVKLVV